MTNEQRQRRLAAAERDMRQAEDRELDATVHRLKWQRMARAARSHGISLSVLAPPVSPPMSFSGSDACGVVEFGWAKQETPKIIAIQHGTGGGRINDPNASINNPGSSLYRGPMIAAPPSSTRAARTAPSSSSGRPGAGAALCRLRARYVPPPLSPELRQLAQMALRDGGMAAAQAAARRPFRAISLGLLQDE